MSGAGRHGRREAGAKERVSTGISPRGPVGTMNALMSERAVRSGGGDGGRSGAGDAPEQASAVPEARPGAGEGVARGTAWMTGAAGVSAMSGLVVAALLTRHLGPEGYGEVTALMAWGAAVATLSDGGVAIMLSREAARRPAERAGLYRSAGRRRVALAVMGMAVGILVPWLAGEADPSLVAVAAMCLAFQADQLLELPLAMLRVQGRYLATALWRAARRLLLVGGIAAAVAVGVTSGGAAMVFLATAVPVALLANGAVRRRTGVAPAGRLPLPTGASALLWLSGVCYWIYFQADQIMLSVMASKVELGYYAPAVAIASGATLMIRAVSDAVVPVLFAQMSPDGDGAAGIRYRTTVHLPVYAFVGSGIWLALTLFAHPLISVLFGPEFSRTAPIVIVLSGFTAMRLLSLPAILALVSLDHLRPLVVTQAGAAVLNIVANLILIPRSGGMGSAIATLGSEACLLVATWWLLPRGWRPDLLRSAAPQAALAGVLILAAQVLPGGLVTATGLVILFVGLAGWFALSQARSMSRGEGTRWGGERRELTPQ